MNFKQLTVCLPAVLKTKGLKKKSELQADRRNLHIFAFILLHVNLPPSLKGAFTVCPFAVLPLLGNKSILFHFYVFITDLVMC